MEVPEVTLVLGPPSRLYLVVNTVSHLRQRNFPNVHWVCMPEPLYLDGYDVNSQARLMDGWAKVVLPLLMKLESERNIRRVHVVEDTAILAPDFDFHDVITAVGSSDGGIWGYGMYEVLKDGPSWHGSKGMTVTAAWWKPMHCK